MNLDEDASIELMRQLRTAGQLQHSWVTATWQGEEGGLHPAAAMLLSELAVHGEVRPSELARRRMVDVSVVSRQIAQLSAAGLVDRRPAPEDGRAALVSVSEQGMIELKRWRGKYLKFFRSALGDWTNAELTALTSRLSQMNDALRSALQPKDRPE
ncbi:MarR family winged helix-turn-helix transcriptional regulator [Amycolatopsis sp.]|uniref:MarR family winged helix-turn-helix transcriptional regulator n=1 Tax=Amycolatopsis sp. TaxID=37632 RepID=UPI002C4226A2|nr:MarR family winged helix-turn-helix transcriptional regulator [Amycolatopsis sp.]HVV09694.1 MarR family winged helix-turn-helix transcriptional regulator [Amycolatopsis sp.]